MTWIREARAEDAAEIARVHWESWETTYRGVLPDVVLDERTVEVRRAFWEQVFHETDGVPGVLVAVTEEGRIAGFVAFGRERSGELECDGEVYALYLLKEHQGRGEGRRLMGEVAARLSAMGCQRMCLWVLAANRTVGFYERMGGSVIARRTERFGGEEFEELAMGWETMDHLRAWR
jgi:ribosomal protein S18 acetylase RimI-like enzyme